MWACLRRVTYDLLIEIQRGTRLLLLVGQAETEQVHFLLDDETTIQKKKEGHTSLSAGSRWSAGTRRCASIPHTRCPVAALISESSRLPVLQGRRWLVPGLQSQLVRSLETTWRGAVLG